MCQKRQPQTYIHSWLKSLKSKLCLYLIFFLIRVANTEFIPVIECVHCMVTPLSAISKQQTLWHVIHQTGVCHIHVSWYDLCTFVPQREKNTHSPAQKFLDNSYSGRVSYLLISKPIWADYGWLDASILRPGEQHFWDDLQVASSWATRTSQKKRREAK